jgi:hypothetical protein
VDVTDEGPELTRAILRLAGEPGTRARLGAAASAHVRQAHAPSRVRDAWEDALERARRRPAPPVRDWPAHWLRP